MIIRRFEGISLSWRMARTRSGNRVGDRTYKAYPVPVMMDQLITYLRELRIPGIIVSRIKGGIKVIKNFEPLFTIKSGETSYQEGIFRIGDIADRKLVVEAIHEKLEYSKMLSDAAGKKIGDIRELEEKEKRFRIADERREGLVIKILMKGGIRKKHGNIEYIEWDEKTIYPTSTNIVENQFFKIYEETQEARDDKQWAVKDLLIETLNPVYRITHESKFEELMKALA